MADQETTLNIESYDDCIKELTRIRDEVDEVTTYMCEYESQGDSIDESTRQKIALLYRHIDDDLGELYSICNYQG